MGKRKKKERKKRWEMGSRSSKALTQQAAHPSFYTEQQDGANQVTPDPSEAR